MKLIVTETVGEDLFTLDEQVAYKDGKIYEVLASTNTYVAGMCMGKMRVIVEGYKILQWIYPLMGAGDFELFDKSKIDKMRRVINAYDYNSK